MASKSTYNHNFPRRVTIILSESDYNWLKHQYGDEWAERIAQHIHTEINNRKQRSGWYDGTTQGTENSTESKLSQARIRFLHGNGSGQDPNRPS